MTGNPNWMLMKYIQTITDSRTVRSVVERKKQRGLHAADQVARKKCLTGRKMGELSDGAIWKAECDTDGCKWSYEDRRRHFVSSAAENHQALYRTHPEHNSVTVFKKDD